MSNGTGQIGAIAKKLFAGIIIALVLGAIGAVAVYGEEAPRQHVDVYVFDAPIREATDSLWQTLSAEYATNDLTSWFWADDYTLYIFRNTQENETLLTELRAVLPVVEESTGFEVPEGYVSQYELLNYYVSPTP